MRIGIARATLLATVAAALVALVAPAGAGATTFTVNTTVDPGTGTCDVLECTLREAITAANGAGGADDIHFSIGGPPPHTIAPATQLPTITDPVTIDGTTEPDFAGTPVVEISGQNAPGDSAGLYITAGSSTVRGLAINRFLGGIFHVNQPLGQGIAIETGGGNVIEGNYLGTDLTGAVDLGNHTGVSVRNSSNNTIGGDTAAERNIVSGNNRYSIYFENFFDTGNTVAGNYIGPTASGTATLPGVWGVTFNFGDQNVVRNNVISGHTGPGVMISAANGNNVHDNLIGTDATGTPGFGNALGVQILARSDSNTLRDNVISGSTFQGVLINNFSTVNPATNNVLEGNEIVQNAFEGVSITSAGGNNGNRIGGSATGAGNEIAFNGAPGVEITDGNTGNRILGNSIHDNTGLGIELNPPAGVTPNDPGDPDTGANDLQNFPLVSSASGIGTNVAVQGTLNSTPSQTFTVDLYGSPACDPSGNGEGETYLGSETVSTNASGNASFTTTLPLTALSSVVTATATNAAGSTSEFSACRNIVYPRPGSGTPLRAPLVVAYDECTAPNANHVLPAFGPDPELDGDPSCTPAVETSDQLTTSTVGRQSGFAKFRSILGDPDTPEDEADILITAQVTDVIRRSSGTDYVGPVILRALLRITDRANNPGGSVPGTVMDTELSLPIDCLASGPPGGLGSSCDLDTALDTLVPGFATEGKRAVISVLSVSLLDAGANPSITPPEGDCPPTCGSGDEEVYLDSGVFAP